jgi:hypothetical protein
MLCYACRHKEPKLEARFTSRRALEAEIMQHLTYKLGWQYLLRGGFNAYAGTELLATLRDPSLARLFSVKPDLQDIADRAKKVGYDSVCFRSCVFL